VEIGDGQTYRESKSFAAGGAAVVADLPVAGTRLGLSVCYDVRFPALYRALAQAGAEILAVPAAFTRVTGEAHWHVLLRARAIENGAFVIAPAQAGRHKDGRETFGHSLVVGPWGEILAEGGTEPGVVAAVLDLSAVKSARQRIPSLQHDRRFSPPAGGDAP
jgi:predicted amidohydrolase